MEELNHQAPTCKAGALPLSYYPLIIGDQEQNKTYLQPQGLSCTKNKT